MGVAVAMGRWYGNQAKVARGRSLLMLRHPSFLLDGAERNARGHISIGNSENKVLTLRRSDETIGQPPKVRPLRRTDSSQSKTG